MTKPYTYLIGWTTKNKFYYGVRYAKNCHPSDLWKTYFTSSVYVKDYHKTYGDPDIIQVRRVFDTPVKAKLWEDKVLRRLNAIRNGNFLNMSNNHSFKGIVMTDEIRNAISNTKNKKNKNKEKQILITDGIEQKYIAVSENIPDGWYRGMNIVNRSIMQNKKNKNTFLHKTPEEMVIIGEKISKKIKGKAKPPGHGENVSKSSRGKPKPWQLGDNNVSKREDVKRKISESWKNRELGVWYTDGTKNYYVKSGEYINSLWRRGQTRKKTPRKCILGKKKWYNDGFISKRYLNKDVPAGWVLGRLFSAEAKQNIKIANSKPKSVEHRKNLSIARKRSHEKCKNGNSDT